ncbi:MAG: hypothetical protein ACRER2_16185 [Methylococcales bacterium]
MNKQTEQSLTRGFDDIANHLPGAVYQLLLMREGGVTLHYVSEGIAGLVGLDKTSAEADVNHLFALVLPEDLPGLQNAMGVVATELRARGGLFNPPRTFCPIAGHRRIMRKISRLARKARRLRSSPLRCAPEYCNIGRRSPVGISRNIKLKASSQL